MNWQPTKLSDIVKIKHGYPFKSKLCTEERAGGPIVVSVGNFSYAGGFRFNETRVREYLGDYPSEFELAPGDVLLIMTCQTSGGEILGVLGRIPDDGLVYLHNQRLGKVEVLDTTAAYLPYLYWLFLYPQFNNHLFQTASGTKILHTAPKRIESFEFTLPPLSEQKRIAAVLGTLDDKIENNRKMNETLEAMAQAIFKSWFVDFDPVIDNALRAGNPIPADLEDKAARRSEVMARDSYKKQPYAHLFPDHFVGSDLGSIPAGCDVGNVGDLLFLQRGFDITRKQQIPGPIPVVSSSGVRSFHNSAKIERPGIVIGRKGTLGTVFRIEQPHWPHDTTLWVKDFKGNPMEFTFWFLRNLSVERLNVGSANPTLNRNHVHAISTLVPKQSWISCFSDFTRVLHSKIDLNQEESRTLASLRDTLLPKLISGEIRIPEIESLVEETLVEAHA